MPCLIVLDVSQGASLYTPTVELSDITKQFRVAHDMKKISAVGGLRFYR